MSLRADSENLVINLKNPGLTSDAVKSLQSLSADGRQALDQLTNLSGEISDRVALTDEVIEGFSDKFGHAGLYLQVEQLRRTADPGEDTLLGPLRVLEKFQAITGAPSITHEEVEKIREQLRRSALNAYARGRYADTILHATDCYHMTKNYLMRTTGTGLHGDLVFDLLLLARSCILTGDKTSGMKYKDEMEYLIQNTLKYISTEVLKSENSGPERIKDAWLKIGDADASVSGPLLRTEPAVFLAVLKELADLSLLYDELDKANSYYERYVTFNEYLYGPVNPITADAANSAARHFFEIRNFHRAAKYAEKCLRIRVQLFGDVDSNDPNHLVADAYSNLGVIYRVLGYPQDALSALLSALDIRMRLTGGVKDEINCVQTLLSIAILCHQYGQYRRALELYGEVFEGFRKHKGYHSAEVMKVVQLMDALARDIASAEHGGASGSGTAFQGSLTICPLDPKANWQTGLKPLLWNESLTPSLAAYRSYIDKKHAVPTKSFGKHVIPGISRMKSLFADDLRGLDIPSTALLPFLRHNFVSPEMLQFLNYLRSFGFLSTDHPYVDGRRRCPVLNLPKIIGGFPVYQTNQQSKVVMELNPAAVHYLKEYNLPQPSVDEDGVISIVDERGWHPKCFLPIMDQEERKYLVGVNGTPLMVCLPLIYKGASSTSKPSTSTGLTKSIAGDSPKLTQGGPPPGPKKGLVTSKVLKMLKPKSANVQNDAEPKTSEEQESGTGPENQQRDERDEPLATNKIVLSLPDVFNSVPVPHHTSEATADMVMGVRAGFETSEQGGLPCMELVGFDGQAIEKIPFYLDLEAYFIRVGAIASNVARSISDDRNSQVPSIKGMIHVLSQTQTSQNTGMGLFMLGAPFGLSGTVFGSIPTSGPEGIGGYGALGARVATGDNSIPAGTPGKYVPKVTGPTADHLQPAILGFGETGGDSSRTSKGDVMDSTKSEGGRAGGSPVKSPTRAQAPGMSESGLTDIAALQEELSDEDTDLQRILAQGGFDLLRAGNLGEGLTSWTGPEEFAQLVKGVIAGTRAPMSSLIRRPAHSAPSGVADPSGLAGAAAKRPEIKPSPPKKAPPPPPVGKKPPPPGGPAPGKKPPPKKKKAPEEKKELGKFKPLAWDPVDDPSGTVFTQQFSDYLKTLELGKLEEVFARIQPKSATGEDVSKKEVKPKIIKLLPDAKRAYTMNIALSKFSKRTFADLRDAIIDMDSAKLSAEEAETLSEYAPLPEEISVVSDYIRGGGDVTKLDRPEQFVAAMMGVPLFKQRMQSFQFMASFTEETDAIAIQIERFKKACKDLTESRRLQKLLNAILKIGNILNESEVHGYRASVLAKLEDLKTTTKPTQTFTEYLVNLFWQQDPDVLLVRQDFQNLEAMGRVDISSCESGLTKLDNGFKALKTFQQMAGKSSTTPDPLEKVLDSFTREHGEVLPGIVRLMNEAKQEFTAAAKLFGETDQTISGMKPESFLKDILDFVRNVDNKRKVKQEKVDRELKRKKAVKSSAVKAPPSAAPPPSTPAKKAVGNENMAATDEGVV